MPPALPRDIAEKIWPREAFGVAPLLAGTPLVVVRNLGLHQITLMKDIRRFLVYRMEIDIPTLQRFEDILLNYGIRGIPRGIPRVERLLFQAQYDAERSVCHMIGRTSIGWSGLSHRCMIEVPHRCWKQNNASLLAKTVAMQVTQELQKIMKNLLISHFARNRQPTHPVLQRIPCVEMVEETVAHGNRTGKKDFTVYVTDCRSRGHLAVRNQIIRGLTAN